MFRDIGDARFVGDESGWISSAYLHTAALAQLDLSPDRWEFPQAGVYGNLNPQVGKLMLGIPLSMWRYLDHGTLPFDRYYDFSMDRNSNIAAGNVPPKTELRMARIITACYGVFVLWIAMAFMGRAFGWYVGIATGLLLAANPTIVASFNRAMTDAAYQFFMISVCVPLLAYVRSCTPRGAYRALACVGVLAGLACSVKITGIVIAGLALLPLLLLKNLRPHRDWRRMILGSVIYALAALITVYALNPFFWPALPETHSSTRTSVDTGTVWNELKSIGYDRSAIEAAYPLASRLLRPLEFPVLFVRWNSLLESQIQSFPTPPPTWASYHARLFGELALFPGDVLLVIAGCAVCLQQLWLEWRQGRVSPFAVPLAFAVVNYVFWTATTRVELNRYYLSTLIALQLLAGMGLGTMARAAVRRLRRNDDSTLETGAGAFPVG